MKLLPNIPGPPEPDPFSVKESHLGPSDLVYCESLMGLPVKVAHLLI